MATGKPSDPADEAFWHDFLTNAGWHTRFKRVLQTVPGRSRCKICAAPFAGTGAPVMRLIGRRPGRANPHVCGSCLAFMNEHHGGAEVECSVLFADVRGSTSIAETMSPTEFRTLLDRFYDIGAEAVFRHDGLVDKFVGDEVMALFVPGLAGSDHALQAVGAARHLLESTGHTAASGPSLPIGAGVHSGRVWMGAIGEGEHAEITAVGDVVNVAARLASTAAAGEILVAADAADAAGLPPDLPRQQLKLRGKDAEVAAVSLRVTPATDHSVSR